MAFSACGICRRRQDGEEATVTNSTDKTKIMDAVSQGTEDFLLAYKNGKKVGWVRLMWGNVEPDH